jgi:hypothetical protein
MKAVSAQLRTAKFKMPGLFDVYPARAVSVSCTSITSTNNIGNTIKTTPVDY